MMAALTASCAKNDINDGIGKSDIPIFIDPSAGSFGTKSIYEPGNFNTAGNALMIYDRITVNGSSSMYINGKEAVCDGTNWNFTSPEYWTKTRIHSFTAYASRNASDNTEISTDANSVADVKYSTDTEQLTVGPWTISSENQFDFIYARHTRSMTETNPYRPVPLQMKHLLCALQFNLVNLIPNDEIHFISIYLNGIYTEGTAVITPSGTSGDSQVSITLGNNNAAAFEKEEDKNLLYNEKYNIFSDKDKIGPDGYVLAWPHPKEMFSEIKATLKYTHNGTETVKQIDLTSSETNNWRAGYRYVYNLYLHDNKISFEVQVLPWVIDDVIIDG